MKYAKYTKDITSTIRERIPITLYAQKYGLPVSKVNDRCTSIAPGEHSHNDAFVILSDSFWYDHTLNEGGDVIKLAMILNHNGDYVSAMQELCDMAGIEPETYEPEIKANQKDVDEITSWIHSWQKAMTEKHYAYFEKRGITRETVKNNCIGYSANMQRLIFPYINHCRFEYFIGRDWTGNDPNKYQGCSLKTHPGLKKKPIWGLHTLGSKSREIIQTRYGDIKKDDWLIIAEGAVDALSFVQEGYRTISPMSGNFGEDNYPEVLSICKTVKYVLLAFDSDEAGKKFTLKNGQTLAESGVKFFCQILPEGVKDTNDFYAAGGNLNELVASAENGISHIVSLMHDESELREFYSGLGEYLKTVTDIYEYRDILLNARSFMNKYELTMLAANTSPAMNKEAAKQVRAEAFRAPSEPALAEAVKAHHTLKYVNNIGIYEYEKGVWKLRSDMRIRKYIDKELGVFSNNSRISNALGLLKTRIYDDSEMNRQRIMNFTNGVLNLDTLDFMPHSPDFLSSIQLNYEYNPDAVNADWENFVAEALGGDEQKITLLQEAFGYVLYEDCSLQTCFIFIGSGGNGKSVVNSVLRALFGKENCRSIEVSAMSRQFHAIHLKDALLNICGDMNTDFKGAEDVLKKAVTGDDPIHDSLKGKDGVDFVPRAKHFFSSNSFAVCNNIDGGLLRRIKFIQFNERFVIIGNEEDSVLNAEIKSGRAKKADTQLTEKLCSNLAGIFNWALKGYKRLRERRAFTNTHEQEFLKHEFMTSVSPLAMFITEKLQYENDSNIKLRNIFLRYKEWCAESGHSALGITRFKSGFESIIQILIPEAEHIIEAGEHRWIFPKRTPEELVERISRFDTKRKLQAPKEAPKETVKEAPKEAPKETVTEAPKAATKAAPKETVRETQQKGFERSDTFDGVKVYPCPMCGEEKMLWDGEEHYGSIYCGTCGFNSGQPCRSDKNCDSIDPVTGDLVHLSAKYKAAVQWNKKVREELGVDD